MKHPRNHHYYNIFNSFGNAEVSLMIKSFLASGFKNSATTSLVYNRSKFQIFNINILNSIEFMRFSGSEKTCRLIRNGTHTIIIFRFVKISLNKIFEMFKIFMGCVITVV